MKPLAITLAIMAVVNQKGGQSKTVTTFHLSEGIQKRKTPLLLADDDKQGSLSVLYPLPPGVKADSFLMSRDLYLDELPKGKLPFQINETTWIIRSDKTWDKGTPENRANFAANLKKVAALVGAEVCLIDTPGALNHRVEAALIAANVVLCPVTIGLLEIEAVQELWNYISAIKTKGLNTKLRVMGLLPSRLVSRSTEAKEGLAMLRQAYGKAILPVALTERAATHQAVARRRPAWLGTKGEGHAAAAKEWKQAVNYILKDWGI